MRKPLSFVPEKRLASILRKPGGLTADQAIAAASRRLESVRDTCLAALDEKIDALAAEPPTPESRGRLYALATEVFGLAGTFGVTELAQAAQSLCLLLANLEESGDVPAAYDSKLADSMRVHIDALRTLRRPELAGDAAARTAVVQGLRKVASRTAAPARTEPA